jgi:hypothetical protein
VKPGDLVLVIDSLWSEADAIGSIVKLIEHREHYIMCAFLVDNGRETFWAEVVPLSPLLLELV